MCLCVQVRATARELESKSEKDRAQRGVTHTYTQAQTFDLHFREGFGWEEVFRLTPQGLAKVVVSSCKLMSISSSKLMSV